MGGKYGVKETKEVLNLVRVVMVPVLKAVAKDGFQVSDVLLGLSGPEFDAALAAAVQDLGLVVSEVAELDLMDDFELGRYAVPLVRELVAAAKKPV